MDHKTRALTNVPQLNFNLQSVDHKTIALSIVPQLNLNLQSVDHKTRAITNALNEFESAIHGS